MIYIKCTKDYLKYFDEKSKLPKFLKKLIFIYRKLFGKITKQKTNNGELWLIPNQDKKFRKSLIKTLNIYHVKTVVVSNNLEIWKEKIKEQGIKVLDGKWLYRYLLLDIAGFIAQSRGVNLNDQIISFAVNNPDDVDVENLKVLARSVRGINFITKENYKFLKLEECMFKEEGIAINIAYNYKRSFLKSDIIINIDLSESEFNKFAFPRKAVIINMQNIKILNKGFNGINILKYEIELPEKYQTEDLSTKDFNKEVLYESFIYKRTLPQNILNNIRKDNLKIVSLQGKNGCIDKKEYLKV